MGSKLIGARIQTDKVKIIETYKSGVDILELADQCNVCVNTMCHKLHIWGVKIRDGDWHKKKYIPKQKFSPELLAQRAINTRINDDPKKGIQYVKFGKATRRDQYLIHNIINRPVIG